MRNIQNKIYTNKKGFTLIELMIIVAIIGILAVVLLSMWAVSSQKKAAVNSYKTTMSNVATAVEMCSGTGTGQAQSGNSGDLICNPTNGTTYPKITSKCGSELRFCVTGSGSNWNLTTGNSSCLAVGCKGCRINCTFSGCTKIEEVPGSGACF